MLENRSDKGLPQLPGVRFDLLADTPGHTRSMQEIARRLIDFGVRYGSHPDAGVPWLCADRPFHLDSTLRERIESLGLAAFALLDTVQHLYRDGDPDVRAHLDHNVPKVLRGLQTDREVVTFRLDLMIERGQPRLTEIEEIYGNVGKMAAFQYAYGVDNSELFQHFAHANLSGIYVDDNLPTYLPEVKLLQTQLKAVHEQDVPVRYFSKFPKNQRGNVWRFCRTRDFEQYDSAMRERITAAECTFINPLFHGYGVKSVLALPFHNRVGPRIRACVGEERYAVLMAGIPHTRYLDEKVGTEVWEDVASGHRDKVLKVVDCPERVEYTWGSRGVFFGDRSATRWRRMVEAASKGGLVADSKCRQVRYMVMDLVESDRFDINFLHPNAEALAVMQQARVRLTPIFWRSNGKVRFLAGHASFVNTSRKVHLGSHAVCAPLDWDRPTTTFNSTRPDHPQHIPSS